MKLDEIDELCTDCYKPFKDGDAIIFIVEEDAIPSETETVFSLKPIHIWHRTNHSHGQTMRQDP